MDKLAPARSAEREMQKMWFNLLFHHSPGCMWCKKATKSSVSRIFAQKTEGKDDLIKGIFTVCNFFFIKEDNCGSSYL